MTGTRHEVRVETARPYAVRVGRGVLGEVGSAVEGSAVVLTDETVAELHLERLDLDVPALAIPPGEETKSFGALEGVLEFLAEMGLDRSSTLVALGGGVVGDLGGLAASLYMRGIEVVQCPTTLLAMVDASIGGKTAVNLEQGKNLAGTVHQPRVVLADTDTLATLPPQELRSGLGEAVKSALIGDAGLLDLLTDRAKDAVAGDAEILAEIVRRCAAVKARVVAADENESGERQTLNLGHTFGHAIERVAGYGRVPHGVAVAAGLGAALAASREIGLLESPDLLERTAAALAALGLPRDPDELRRTSGLELPTGELLAAMRTDKKGRRGEPRFVLVREIGSIESGVVLEPGLVESLSNAS